MKTMTSKLATIQNIGLIDRVFRVVLAAILIGGPAYHLYVFDVQFALPHGILMLLSVYPALTGILGWEPFYQVADTKSCGDTERNQCGTLPYQVDAALGHHPIPDDDSDHSLVGSHHR